MIEIPETSGKQLYDYQKSAINEIFEKIDENQSKIAQKFKLDLPQSANTQSAVNQYFM